jgi:hypothetical protein
VLAWAGLFIAIARNMTFSCPLPRLSGSEFFSVIFTSVIRLSPLICYGQGQSVTKAFQSDIVSLLQIG